jgi:hypothetical protein
MCVCVHGVYTHSCYLTKLDEGVNCPVVQSLAYWDIINNTRLVAMGTVQWSNG